MKNLPKMRSVYTLAPTACATTMAILLSGTAFAQLSATGSAASQQDSAGQSISRNAAATQVAVPQPEPSVPFQPAVIDTIPATPTPNADEGSKPAAQRKITPPNEFERFVSGIIGTQLRRFGAELLMPDARDFATPTTTAVPSDYRLNPGDELIVGLTGSVQATNLRLIIDSEGKIFVPRVGAIQVSGVRYGDVKGVISSQVARQYRGFDLQVTAGRLHGITVYVTGFAALPGSYTVSSLSTLVNAVLAAGGPASGGSFRSIQLRRGGQLISDFDLYDLLLKGDKSGDMTLQNGDVIYVAPAGEQVAVIGSVNHEAIFEVGAGETLNDALLYAGGVSSMADSSRLLMLDSLNQSSRGWLELTPQEVQTRPAKRGNIVRVLSYAGIAQPLRQQPVLVTLSGEVVKPGRYYVQPGTRLADVVKQAGGLTAEAYPYAGVITRESVLQQQRSSHERAIKDLELLLTTQPVVSVSRAQLAQSGSLTLVRSVVDQLRAREPTGRLVFNVPPNAVEMPGNLILENNDTVYVPPRPVSVGVFGAVTNPASFSYEAGETIGDFLRSAGGIQKLGDKKEVFVVRANGTVLSPRSGSVLRQRALPGDLIYVPVDADRGEFWARVRDITGTLFGGLVSAASVKAIVE